MNNKKKLLNQLISNTMQVYERMNKEPFSYPSNKTIFINYIVILILSFKHYFYLD